MTEAEWQRGTDPGQMLDALYADNTSGVITWLQRLRGRPAGPVTPSSERKLRLLACAYCRRIADLMDDERSLRAVETAERHADGRATDAELVAARVAARGAYEARARLAVPASLSVLYRPLADEVRAALLAALAAVEVTRFPREALTAARRAAMIAAVESDNPRWAVEAAGDAVHAALIREIFGNPFREVILDPAWLRWNDGTVPRIARGIYDDYRFADLPILHDALLDAGCDGEDILAHCRTPEGHVRGCWVIDLLLGKS
jgi:hypothetical protein